MKTRTTSPRLPHINRRRFLQLAAAVGTLTGAGALLDACGSTGSTTSSGPATITVMAYNTELAPIAYTGTLPNNQAYYVNSFNQLHKGSITANFLNMDQTRLTAMLAAGTPPDYVRTVGGPEIATLMAKKVASDLQTHFAKSAVIKESNLVPINDYYLWDGQNQGQGNRYGMAKDWSQDAMFWYNTDLFQKKGVKPLDPTTPITYDELFQLSKELTTTANGKIAVYGLDCYAFNFWPQPMLMQILGQNGQQLYSDNGTRANIANNDVIYRAVKWWVDYTRAKIDPNTTNDTTGIDALWKANRAATFNLGWWFGGFIRTSDGTLAPNAAFAPAPQMGPVLFNSSFFGTGGWIPVKSKQIDAAFTFMEYYLGGGGPGSGTTQGIPTDPATNRAAGGWGLPALTSLVHLMPQNTPAGKAAFDVQQTALTHYKHLTFSPYDTGFNSAWTEYMPDVYTGKTDLKTALKSIDAAVNQAIQQQF